MPAFLQETPYSYNEGVILVDISYNDFECPLPSWCDQPPTGNGACAPCIQPSQSPSPLPLPTLVAPSTSAAPTPSVFPTPMTPSEQSSNGDGGSNSPHKLEIGLILL